MTGASVELPTPEEIEAIRSEYAHCFACGRGNPIGMHLDGFARVDGEVVVSFTPRPEYAGFDGVLHGGIVATALDEIMAWSAMLDAGSLVYTGTMELRYRKVAPVDAEYELRGRVDEQRGRRFRLSGRMLTGGGEVASASGLYVRREAIAAAGGD